MRLDELNWDWEAEQYDRHVTLREAVLEDKALICIKIIRNHTKMSLKQARDFYRENKDAIRNLCNNQKELSHGAWAKEYQRENFLKKCIEVTQKLAQSSLPDEGSEDMYELKALIIEARTAMKIA